MDMSLDDIIKAKKSKNEGNNSNNIKRNKLSGGIIKRNRIERKTILNRRKQNYSSRTVILKKYILKFFLKIYYREVLLIILFGNMIYLKKIIDLNVEKDVNLEILEKKQKNKRE